MSAEAPTYTMEMTPIGIEPVGSLPADLFDRTVAVARGPVGSPETGYGSMIDLMSEGYAIERNPEPVATVIVPGPSPENVLESIFESPEQDGATGGLRFETYGPHMENDSLDSTLATGIALVSEQGIVKPVFSETDPSDIVDAETSQPAGENTGRGKNLLMALRRSRLGKVAAVTALAAGELLSFGTASAHGADTQLEQECVQAALKRPQILKTGIKHAGRRNQFGVLEAQYDDMPADCLSDYRRSSSARLQTLRNGKWVNISYEGGVVNQTPAPDGTFNPSPQTAFKGEFEQPPDSHAPSWYYHPCRARLLLREVVSHPQQTSDSGYHPNPPIAHKMYPIGISPSDIRPHSFRANNC